MPKFAILLNALSKQKSGGQKAAKHQRRDQLRSILPARQSGIEAVKKGATPEDWTSLQMPGSATKNTPIARRLSICLIRFR